MTNVLKVIKPFFVMEQGDEFELSDNGNYVSEYSSEYTGANDKNEISSTYTSTYEISPSYAYSLIKDGYLKEVSDKDSVDFVNVFDEIEKLYNEYAKQLTSIDSDYDDKPACLKVEKETVLKNMMKVLDHLHSLKK